MDKHNIRCRLLDMRNKLSNSYIDARKTSFFEVFLSTEFSHIPSDMSIMLYASFKNEAYTWDLIDHFYSRGTKVVLPCIVNDILIVREFKGTEHLKKEGLGILSPDPAICPEADLSKIHTVITPGVGFDSRGGRIGFGRGYYDKFLPLIPNAIKIGMAYRFQICPEIPTDEHDIPMDYILTENGIISCKK